MVVQTEKIPGRSGALEMSSQERTMAVRERLSRQGISILEVLGSKQIDPEEVAFQLDVEEVRVCRGGLNGLLEAVGRGQDGHRRIGGALEIQSPAGNIPHYELDGQRQHAINLLASSDNEILGRINIQVPNGLSTLALFAARPHDMVLRSVIQEGSNPTAMMIARPYSTN